MEAPKKLTDLHGKVTLCKLCMPKNNPHHVFCTTCFNRGFVAECLWCEGVGHSKVPVAGSKGEMLSTCNYCGGKGSFPSSKEKYEAQKDNEPVVEKLPEEGIKTLADGTEVQAEFPLSADSEKQRLIEA